MSDSGVLQLRLELVQRGAQRAVVEDVADDQTHAPDQLGLVRGGQQINVTLGG